MTVFQKRRKVAYHQERFLAVDASRPHAVIVRFEGGSDGAEALARGCELAKETNARLYVEGRMATAVRWLMALAREAPTDTVALEEDLACGLRSELEGAIEKVPLDVSVTWRIVGR